MDHISILDHRIELPLQLSSILPFSSADKKLFPWLEQSPRLYTLLGEVGKGGRATAYRGLALRPDGSQWDGNAQVVIKIPTLDPSSRFAVHEVNQFLLRQIQDSTREWQLTRGRLEGCEYANPIFDFGMLHVHWIGELLTIPVSAQLYLTDAKPLDQYLLDSGQRTEPYLSQRNRPVDNWYGMKSASEWSRLGRSIAVGLADIHRRRVVHGDIWPPNIFIRQLPDGSVRPVFIDFGESYPLEPKGTPLSQRDHAYRAPERASSQNIVTQQADVYSFGKLLLHLAIGEEPILEPAIRGHLRRDGVRKKIKARNQALVNDNPFIMDMICHCISVDPIDRPSMDDVVRAFDSYLNHDHWEKKGEDGIRRTSLEIISKWDSVSTSASGQKIPIPPFFSEIINQKLEEVSWLVEGLQENVVLLRDTRERLMMVLLRLFQDLGTGDRFVSLTSPRMWQGTALGLDGRYFTASRLAASRGSAIQRVFVVSVQELGSEWCSAFAERLEREGGVSGAAPLAAALRPQIAEFNAKLEKDEVVNLPSHALTESRLRLLLVLKSYLECIQDFEFTAQEFNPSLRDSSFLGLLFRGTIEQVREIKSSHPVSLFYYSNIGTSGEYLLMMTDCYGRTAPSGLQGNLLEERLAGEARPELRGLTLFKSVLGVPENRIKALDQVFSISDNVGCWLRDLVRILDEMLTDP